MKFTFTPKQRKWIRRLFILFVIRLVLGAVIYYIVFYRFKDIVQIMVKRQSKGLYAFDASDVKFSIWNKNIVVENAALYCTDTLRAPTHYDLEIPRVYLAIDSWSALLFHRKMLVDSLNISLPSLKTHTHGQTGSDSAPVVFHTSRIMDLLQYMVVHLKVRSFTMENGSFAYSTTKNKTPFFSDRINLSIRDFSAKEKQSEHLFSSDDVDLSIGRQRWQFPDGIHDISFSRLHFSGKNQFFELDSCTFHAAATAEKGEVTLNADKFFFNSTRLSAIYEKGELSIDTLICVRPVLNIRLLDRKKQEDSALVLNQSIRHIFKHIHFKYIDIRDGGLSLGHASKYQATYTQKTNLKLFNLRIVRDSQQHIQADSIQLSLRNIRFITQDSLFQLSIDEFALNNQDLLFKNAVYGPTPRNRSDKVMTFTAPSLRLQRISLQDLLKRKLKADQADLVNPLIVLSDKGNPKKNRSSIADSTMGRFYKTLHGLRELIDVRDFNIVHGNVRYNSSGRSPLHMGMKDLDAKILLDHFLTSDSLIDIKRSLPEFSVGGINVKSPKLKLEIDHYTFQGLSRHNRANGFRLSMAGGSAPAGLFLEGKKLYWEILDWDLFEKYQYIQVENIKIHSLTVHAETGGSVNSRMEKKNLPVIHIGRMDIDQLKVDQIKPEGGLHLEGSDLCLDEVNSVGRALTWKNTEGLFSHIAFSDGKGLNASIDTLLFTNEYETLAKGASLSILKEGTAATTVLMPLLKLQTGIRSTDFSQLSLRKLNIPEAVFRFRSEKGKDTLQIAANLALKATDLKLQKTTIHWEKTTVGLSEVRVTKGSLDLQLPRSLLTIDKGGGAISGGTIASEGKIPFFEGALSFQWFDGNLHAKKPGKIDLALEKLSGTFSDPEFTLYSGKKFAWPFFLDRLSISQGKVMYKDKTETALAEAVSWEPLQKELVIRSFSLLPNLSKEETFSQPGAWQSDYITVSGDAVKLTGLNLSTGPNDSSLHVNRVLLENLSLSASRDKRMPFEHGIEKLMPGKLISRIPIPVRIDSIRVLNGKVTVNELSLVTGREGSIPIEGIDAYLTHIHNRDNMADSLDIRARATIFKSDIRDFHYKESYGDSLSFYSLRFNTSQMLLPEFSQATTPLASLRVDRGKSDTLFAKWAGNKYATIGVMNFHYKDLKVSLLDKNDPDKKTFLLSLANWLANTAVIRKNNTRESIVFFERDREKFIFNYWVKSALRGLFSSVGFKSSRKYIREYRKIRDEYSLPPNPGD